MVVLSTDGVVTNLNATDMVWLWGAKAFPFSASREKELWEQENRILQLLIHGIDPLLTNWVSFLYVAFALLPIISVILKQITAL